MSAAPPLGQVKLRWQRHACVHTPKRFPALLWPRAPEHATKRFAWNLVPDIWRRTTWTRGKRMCVVTPRLCPPSLPCMPRAGHQPPVDCAEQVLPILTSLPVSRTVSAGGHSAFRCEPIWTFGLHVAGCGSVQCQSSWILQTTHRQLSGCADSSADNVRSGCGRQVTL